MGTFSTFRADHSHLGSTYSVNLLIPRIQRAAADMGVQVELSNLAIKFKSKNGSSVISLESIQDALIKDDYDKIERLVLSACEEANPWVNYETYWHAMAGRDAK